MQLQEAQYKKHHKTKYDCRVKTRPTAKILNMPLLNNRFKNPHQLHNHAPHHVVQMIGMLMIKIRHTLGADKELAPGNHLLG